MKPSEIIKKADTYFCNLMEQEYGDFETFCSQAGKINWHFANDELTADEYEKQISRYELGANAVWEYLRNDEVLDSADPPIEDLVLYYENSDRPVGWFDYITDSRDAS